MNSFLCTIPLYFWYAGRTQVISRLCHPVAKLSQALTDLLTRILQQYPRRMAWALTAALRSEDAHRRSRIEQIWSAACTYSSAVNDTLVQTKRLAGKLIDLAAEKPKTDDQTVSLSKSSLACANGLLRAARAAKLVLIPTQAALAVQLPLGGAWYDDDHADAAPFGTGQDVCIAALSDKMNVYSSLQKPKRVEFTGTDGQRYFLLCKQDDDL